MAKLSNRIKALIPTWAKSVRDMPAESLVFLFRLPEVKEKFYQHFKMGRADECWHWREQSDSYGTFSLGKLYFAAHRASWLIHNERPIPAGYLICHKCNNPPCVNPLHLYAGTAQENMEDIYIHGKQGRKPELTKEDVILIRTSSKTIRELSEEVNASYQVVHAALYGKTWRSLIDPPPKQMPVYRIGNTLVIPPFRVI